MSQPTAPSQKFDVNFLNPFITSTLKVLKIQCQVDAKPGSIRFKKDGEKSISDIAGVIGLTSTVFSGSIAVCYPKDTFLKIMGGMLTETFTEITKDLEDGAGELINIIFGQAKIILNEKGYAIEKAIPSIIKGSAIEIRHLTPSPTIIIPFESNVGSFSMEIGLEPKSA